VDAGGKATHVQLPDAEANSEAGPQGTPKQRRVIQFVFYNQRTR
jgi:hypothetical protein